ncbi:YARHG domain-containing protein [Bradyrhizobium sp. LMG 9283]|uniref:YARHG domain-containing protein n=1 Tax=Bradyrhizobium sp. LMG 9283 TaxID=592064 RepID=UPI0038905B94
MNPATRRKAASSSRIRIGACSRSPICAGFRTTSSESQRNEIFARRGRYFESANLKTRFERFSWYSPNTWNPKLNSIEEANVALLEQAGKRR